MKTCIQYEPPPGMSYIFENLKTSKTSTPTELQVILIEFWPVVIQQISKNVNTSDTEDVEIVRFILVLGRQAVYRLV